MSLLRSPKLRSLRSRLASIRDRFGGKSRQGSGPLKYRRLTVDPLEDRVLLSVSPADWDDVLVNQNLVNAPQVTVDGQSIAVDDDGDFVVAWTRYDPVYQLDTNGDPVLDPITGNPVPVVDPATGEPMLDANVYARYFTDEVQRLTLPDVVVADPVGDVNDVGGSFTLRYGGNEVQKISITATYEPFSYFQDAVAGAVTLGFDVDGNGSIIPGETTTIVFDEWTQEYSTIARSFQTALQGLGGALTDVQVRGISPQEFLVEFGDLSQGEDQPQISVESVSFTSGFLPAVITSTVREPVEIGPILVSESDPDQTANAIEQWFLLTSTDFPIGPINFPPVEGNRVPSWVEGPYYYPLSMRTALPGVTVSPVLEVNPADGSVQPSKTKFDIRFDGAIGAREGGSGKKDHPLLVVSQVTDQNGVAGVDTNGNGMLDPDEEYAATSEVETLKEPSPEFRVNPPEPDNPFTPLPDRTAQTLPAVAMDADGEFVITWQGTVPGASVADVFARRFTPSGVVEPGDEPFLVDTDFDGVEDTPVTGVRALVTPEAEYVQRLTFDATGAPPLSGSFRLQIGSAETNEIMFDSTDLESVAGVIETELGQLAGGRYRDVIVTVVSGSDPYQFEVKLKTTFQEQLDEVAPGDPIRPTISILANPAELPATVAADYYGVQQVDKDPYTFRVNTETTNAQGQPHVGLDEDGDFVITWASGAQDLSFFNSIWARRYDRSGAALDLPFMVNTEDTSFHVEPYVALSHNGNFVVTWTTTDDPDYIVGDGYTAGVLAALYDKDGQTLLGQFGVGGGGGSTADFDLNENFAISRHVGGDPDNPPSTSIGVRGVMYELDGTLIRDTFRANSASFDLAANTLWPLFQGNAQVVLDADGDMVISYEGFGPDVSEDVSTGFYADDKSQQFLIDRFYRPENADLLQFFDPAVETLPVGWYYDPSSGQYVGGAVAGDVDSVIDQLLLRALSGSTSGGVPATNEQLGRIRALVDEVIGLVRGEANGVMFTRLDADPSMDYTVLFSDCVANAHRDGHTSRFIVTVPTTSTGGNFTLRLWSGNASGWEDIQISPVYQNQTLNVSRTRDAIETALRGAARTGVNWPRATYYEGPVDVRTVSYGFGFVDGEITSRTGTPWDYEYAPEYWYPDAITDLEDEAVYEVTFQGEGHDTYFYMYLQNNGLNPQGVEAPKVFFHTDAYEGTYQGMASVGMEPDGDFVMVWTQYEETTSYMVSNQNIYYRRFDEDTDTAGPRLSDLTIADGKMVVEGHAADLPVQTITLTFNEDMLTSGLDSVTNPANYRLLRDQVEIFGAVVQVAYGLNKASDLAGTINPLTGSPYDLNPIPTNKWEAVITLDGDPSQPGVQPLKTAGNYQLVAVAPRPAQGRSGLRDKAGVPLGRTGFAPAGADLARSFALTKPDPDDVSVTQDPWPTAQDPWTHAETREAVAMDPDGDHVVVWTQRVGGVDKVYYRMFDADGTPADLDLNRNGSIDPWEVDASPAFPVTLDPQFDDDAQRFGTVACDADGDFVVTWTNYRDEGGVINADIFGKRFDADGTSADDITTLDDDEGVFRVNTYTENQQKWSDVAIDPDGDFVVTWSSYGQEDGGDLGAGYGVYARQFDSFAQPRGDEFPVNVTTGGHQQFAAVAMDEAGGFVIVWTSDQNGVGDDIFARLYEPDGKPKVGPLSGEYPVNGYSPGDYTAGNQRYPDVAITPSGDSFVVVWTSANQDGSSDGVFGRAVNVRLLEQTAPLVMRYDYQGPALDFGFGDTEIATIDVPFDIPINNFQIADVNVEIADLRYGQTSDVELTLYHPDNTPVTLVANEPDPFQPSSDFINTLFDDEAADNIINGYTGPFTGSFQPEGLVGGAGLHLFDGRRSSGTWRLVCQDNVDNLVNTGTLNDWSLIITRIPAMGPIFQINQTIIGNQQFASLAMGRQGGFTVAWSGNGDRPGQADQDGSGVFFREYGFGGTPLTAEARANATTTGNQRFASVDSDGPGNYAMVWTGDVGSGMTDVFRYLSTDFKSVVDADGPVVAGVLLEDGTPLVEGDALDFSDNVAGLIVTFSENLSVRGGATGPDSVLNLSNWVLERNGAELSGVLQDVQFALNPLSRKYEARLLLDTDLSTPAPDGLFEGNYTLVALDTINDAYGYRPGDPYFGGNSLDGDFDGTSGTDPGGQGHAGYTFNFTVATEPARGPEFRINQAEFKSLHQTFSEPLGLGYGREQSTRSVAVDHDGDYVAVWTSYGQDDSSEINGGVYFRMYDRDDNPLTDETLVNTVTEGHQRNAAVAIDADGEFVVVWEAENDNVDGSWGIYGQRFSSTGQRLGGQFRINTTVQNDQLNPSVAMDDFGNFIVVWAAKGQPYSYFNDVRGQVYNYRGERIGSEFLVNTAGIPGTGAGPGTIHLNPAVAMADDGSIVVAWDQITAQQNGVITDSQIFARIFDATVTAVGPEFTMPSDPGSPGNPDIGRTSRNPQVVMDEQGGFIVVWESWVDAPDASYSVFFEQFDASGASVADGLVSQMVGGEQVNASVAVDADGDFAVVWNGQGARPDPLFPGDPNRITQQDDEGVFVRSYHSGSAAASVQSRVNITELESQRFGSIGMERDGDMIVVWSGAGVGDRHGVFGRRYDEPTDTAGPKVSDLLDETRVRIEYGAQLTRPLTQLVVVFDEKMMGGDPALVPDSVFNPNNYSLLKDGVELTGGISAITNYDLLPPSSSGYELKVNPDTNKWEAVLNLDPALGDGHYELVVSRTLRDWPGNRLGYSGWYPAGQDFVGQFDIVVFGGQDILVNDRDADPGSRGEDQYTRLDPGGQEHSPQAIAGDADGEYVIVWTDTTPGGEGVYAKVYNGLRWTKGPTGQRESSWDQAPLQIQVTDDPTAMFASVARDADGDFVVTWSQNDGTTAQPNWNVWARRYDATGTPFEDAFLVNSVTDGTQRYSTVAMDVDGDFVITWQSNDQVADLQGRARDGDGYGVYAQRYSPAGEPLGGTNEVQSLTFTENPVGTFTLYWDGDGNPGTPNDTNPIAIDGNPFGTADQIEAELNALAGDVNRVEVQAISLTEVIIHFIDEGAARDQEQIIVASTNFVDPLSDVIAGTLMEGYTGEFLVNDTTLNNQMFPTVAMSAEGDIVISWTSAGQDGDASHETNIYAKKFISNDSFRYLPDPAGARSYAWGRLPEEYRDLFLSTSTDDPANHVVNPGSGYDGVVGVGLKGLQFPWGSGILLSSGRHVLTAAHVAELLPGIPWPLIDVEFALPSGPVTMTSTDVYIHPGWNGDPFNADDLAIIVLPEQAPAGVQRYDLYRGTNELGKVAEIVGYGTAGQGAEQFFDNQKRAVKNVFEVYGEAFNGLSDLDFNMFMGIMFDMPAGKLLSYDFDNGLAQNDMFGTLFGIHDLGLGQEEGAAAHGDSGGPAFIDGLVAGVASFIMDYTASDIDGIPFNASFGSAGFYVRVSAYADWIDMMTQSTSPEFLVNDVPLDPVTGLPMPTGDQKWSSVAMDADGDFVITWTSYGQDGSPNPYIPGSYLGEEGVVAKRFNADTSEFIDPATGLPLGEFLVNTASDGKQQHSQVAMDADGDFVIVWESSTDRPGLQADPDPNFGVFAQRYAANDRVGVDVFLGPNGEIGGELPVNATMAGDQRFPSVTLDDTGDTVIVWAGYGDKDTADQEDQQGIYHQRFESLEDEAGPTVADVINVIHSNGSVSLQQLTDNIFLESGPTQLLVSFGEDLADDSPSLLRSITNLNNWILTRDGNVLGRGVSSVEFGLNRSSAGAEPILGGETNKYEAVLTLDGDPTEAGNQPLGAGVYVLTIRNYVQDQFSNRLDGDYDGAAGADFKRTFVVSNAAGGPPREGVSDQIGDPQPGTEDARVNYDSLGNQDSPAVASDAAGNYVVVWVETVDVLDPAGAVMGQDSNIKARRYDAHGQPIGGEFIVNSYRAGDQLEPDVAMDTYGNFVVTWSGEGEVDAYGTLDQIGVFARVFDAFGQPLDEQFAVNQSGAARKYAQRQPRVAMDADGDFAISWTSYGQDGDLDGVYHRRYNFLGEAKDDEDRVNTVWNNYQAYSDIAMDADGNYVVVWAANQHAGDNSEWGIFAQRYSAGGVKLNGEVLVNTHTADSQIYPAVAMDADGNFVVTWASDMTDGGDWGVYARRYNAAGSPLNGSDFRVNQTTLYSQYQPDVSMDDDGDFVITWTTVGQDNVDANDKGIFARAYNANGTDYVDPNTGAALGEFQVNATVIGDQWDSAVALDADGDFAVVWVGPDFDGIPPNDDFNGIYHRHIRINAVSGSTVGGGGGGVYYAGDDEVETSPVLLLAGTAGNDLFQLIAGPTAASSVVLVNGVAQAVQPGTTSVRFDGRGGSDTVIFTGSVGSETVTLWPDHGTFRADRYTVSVVNVESIRAHGGGGTDVAVLRDDPDGVDYAWLKPNYGRLRGDGFDNQVTDFRYVHAYASDGAKDVALLFDDPHTADTLQVTPEVAVFSGSGFFSRASNFRYLHVYATEGSKDVAILNDNSAGRDTFEAWPDQARLYGSEFFARVMSFASVRAYATEGNGDVAILYDHAEKQDTFKATPDQASLFGDGFYNQANSFDSVKAYATEGNRDVALLYGAPGQADWFRAVPDQALFYGDGFYNQANSFDYAHGFATEGDRDVALLSGVAGQADTFKAWPDQGLFYGKGFYNRALSFDYVHGFAGEGDGDVAIFYDNPETADTFDAWPEVARLRGRGFYNQAKGFDQVRAYATEGNGDVAFMYDDPGAADLLQAWPETARFTGDGFANWAAAFDYVRAYATEGDRDVALLYDDPDTADYFKAWPDAALLYHWKAGAGYSFYNRVNSFDYVHAYATEGGKDVALLYDDPDTADVFQAWPNTARLYHWKAGAGYSFYNRVNSFRYVHAYATQGGNDVARLYDSEGKDTLKASPEMAQLYNGSFFNRANYFRNTYSYSTAGGDDSAYLSDSALEEYPDHFEADAGWARLSNELLGYAHWLTEFEEVTVTLSNENDTKFVDPDALDFILYSEGW